MQVKRKARRSGKITLDANGNGTVTLTPDPHWAEWIVTRVPVKTSQPSGTTPVPTAEVFENDAGNFDNHHGGTRDGDLDVGTGRIELSGDDVLLVVFTGGRPGDTAFASAWGYYTRDIAWPGRS